jgi:hypothetical protein
LSRDSSPNRSRRRVACLRNHGRLPYMSTAMLPTRVTRLLGCVVPIQREGAKTFLRPPRRRRHGPATGIIGDDLRDLFRHSTAAMQAAGSEHTVVLRGNAVNYAVAGQGAPGLTVGEGKQTQAPKMDRDVADLIDKRKIPVYVVEEDLTERGIERRELISGVKLLSRAALPGVCDEHAIVSLW